MERSFEKGLKRARKLAGYSTQQALADACKKSPQTIMNWEQQGRAKPSLDDFLSLCDLFGCDADYLLGTIDEKTHDLQFICDQTGLTAEAISRLTDKTNIDHDRIITALNTLLLSTNFLNMLSDLAEYESEYKKLHDLCIAKNKHLVSSESIQPTPMIDELIQQQTMKMRTAEYSARDNYAFVMQEIRGNIIGNRPKISDLIKQEMRKFTRRDNNAGE